MNAAPLDSAQPVFEEDQARADVEHTRRTATARPNGAVNATETLVSKEDVTKSRDKRFGDQINVGAVVSKILQGIKRGG